MADVNQKEGLQEALLDNRIEPLPVSSRAREDTATSSNSPDEDEEAQMPKLGDSRGDSAGVTWVLTTFLMLGDMFGLGTLTLPADFARLGWLAGAGSIALCAAGTLYSGRLFTLLAQKVPRAHVFDDYGAAALGRLGRRLVYVTVYLTIAGEPVIFHLTCMEALRQSFYWLNLSHFQAGSIVAGLMLFLAQVRELEEVSGFSVVGILGMLLAVVVALAKVLRVKVEDYQPTQLIHRPESVRITLVAIMDIVFTYGEKMTPPKEANVIVWFNQISPTLIAGRSLLEKPTEYAVNWVRYLTSMTNPSQFPRSVAATNSFMTVAYLVMGGTAYWKLGRSFDQTQPITSILPQDGWSVVMNGGLFLHCLLAYQINLNVWTHLAQHFIAPDMNQPRNANTWRGRASWLTFSCLGIAYSFGVAATFPFFSTVMAIIASLGDLASAYTLPALFVLVLAGSQLSSAERGLCYVIIPVSFALSAWGVVSSVMQLIHEFSKH